MNHLHHKRRTSQVALRPPLTVVTTPPTTIGSARHRTDPQTYGLHLTFGELALIYKSLQAVTTLGALPPQDEPSTTRSSLSTRS